MVFIDKTQIELSQNVFYTKTPSFAIRIRSRNMAFINQTKIESPQTAFYTRSPIFRVKSLIVDKNYNTYTQLCLVVKAHEDVV